MSEGSLIRSGVPGEKAPTGQQPPVSGDWLMDKNLGRSGSRDEMHDERDNGEQQQKVN
jgi:hypothetical protein